MGRVGLLVGLEGTASTQLLVNPLNRLGDTLEPLVGDVGAGADWDWRVGDLGGGPRIGLALPESEARPYLAVGSQVHRYAARLVHRDDGRVERLRRTPVTAHLAVGASTTVAAGWGVGAELQVGLPLAMERDVVLGGSSFRLPGRLAPPALWGTRYQVVRRF